MCVDLTDDVSDLCQVKMNIASDYAVLRMCCNLHGSKLERHSSQFVQETTNHASLFSSEPVSENLPTTSALQSNQTI